jgi:hypothetical protein
MVVREQGPWRADRPTNPESESEIKNEERWDGRGRMIMKRREEKRRA